MSKKKVFLGLSGGVDSAVALYLLLEAGYDVTCGFMRNWDSMVNNDFLGNPDLNLGQCAQEIDYQDAKKVADQLGVPLLRIDFVKEYWDDVFSRFLDDTQKGLTPNPDVLCNKYIKFDAFDHFARKQGFDYLATGHYAGLIEIDGKNYLTKAKDLSKDQSYFLSQVPFDSLQHSLFPLATVTKHEVRDLALKMKLAVAKKKDSTGICFIGERNYRNFLQNYLNKKEGLIVDIETLQPVGDHPGVMYFTEGQRHGLNISSHHGPFYVCGKDPKTNTLYVARGSQSPYLFSDACLVGRINWYGPKVDRPCMAKFRYRQVDNPVYISWRSDGLLDVKIDPAVANVAKGQEAVFYDQDRVLGGGQILETYQNGQSFLERLLERKGS